MAISGVERGPDLSGVAVAYRFVLADKDCRCVVDRPRNSALRGTRHGSLGAPSPKKATPMSSRPCARAPMPMPAACPMPAPTMPLVPNSPTDLSVEVHRAAAAAADAAAFRTAPPSPGADRSPWRSACPWPRCVEVTPSRCAAGARRLPCDGFFADIEMQEARRLALPAGHLRHALRCSAAAPFVVQIQQGFPVRAG